MTEQNDRDAKVGRYALGFCLRNWPELTRYVDASVTPLVRHKSVMGVCSHPEFADDFYVHSRGGKKLVADANVPSGFQWIGVQNRGGSEYVFAMWRDHERWFWFYDQFVVYYANSSPSTERTQRR
jgi:hypothetical protein